MFYSFQSSSDEIWKFSGTENFTKKIIFSPTSVHRHKKNVAGFWKLIIWQFIRYIRGFFCNIVVRNWWYSMKPWQKRFFASLQMWKIQVWPPRPRGCLWGRFVSCRWLYFSSFRHLASWPLAGLAKSWFTWSQFFWLKDGQCAERFTCD